MLVTLCTSNLIHLFYFLIKVLMLFWLRPKFMHYAFATHVFNQITYDKPDKNIYAYHVRPLGCMWHKCILLHLPNTLKLEQLY